MAKSDKRKQSLYFPEEMLQEIAEDGRFAVERVENGSSIALLRPCISPEEARRTDVDRKDVIVPRPIDSEGLVAIRINPTILGREPSETAHALLSALIGQHGRRIHHGPEGLIGCLPVFRG